MTIISNIKFSILFVACIIASSLKASETFQDVVCQKNAQFTRQNSSVFVKCYYTKSCPEAKIALRSFEIKRHADKTNVIGKISTKYIFEEKQLYIAHFDVDDSYRGQGYGQEALRTVLGIYRSSKNNHLNFDHFFLTVGTGHDRAAARHIYDKLGFQVVEKLDFGYQNMRLARS